MLHVDVHDEPPGPVRVQRGQRPHRREPRHPPPLQSHRLPDAGGLQVRAPVPPKRTGHFAYGVEGVRIGPGTLPDHLLQLLRVVQRGVEPDRQRDLPVPQPITHVEPVAAVHVRRPAQLGAVEGDRRDRVEPVEDQVDPLVTGGRRGRERRRVEPGRTVEPRQRRLVLAQVRVRDQLGVQQVGVHRAGHRRRHRLGGDPGGHRATGGTHGPARVKVGSDH